MGAGRKPRQDGSALRVLQAIGSVDRAAGGPSIMLAGFARELVGQGIELRIVAQREEGGAQPVSLPGEARLDLFRAWWPSAYGPNWRLARHLARTARSTDVVHVFGLWRAINRYAADAALRSGTPLLLSPQGMLEAAALGRSRFVKALARKLWQDAHVRGASCLHATGMLELESIRAAGFSNPVAVIPNGVDLPALERLPSRSRLQELCPELGLQRFFLYLGRLHAFKGVLDLLAAWASVRPAGSPVRLCLAGPIDQGFKRVLEREIEARGLEESVVVIGPVAGEKKAALLANACALVLPSQSENFGIAVAEALAHGRPAVANRGSPWQILTREGCGLWIEQGIPALVEALAWLLAAPDAELDAMGRRGRRLVEREFSWPRVGAMLAETYRWMVGFCEMPAWVVTA